MEGRIVRLRGTILSRPNGKYTVVSPPVWNDIEGRETRASLGTFTTEAEARALHCLPKTSRGSRPDPAATGTRTGWREP